MLSKLSEKQVAQMVSIREDFFKKFRSCGFELDKEKATELINMIYGWSGLKNPQIVFLDSPMAIQMYANMITNMGKALSNVRGDIGSYIHSRIDMPSYEQVRKDGWDAVAQVTEEIQIQILNQINAKIVNTLRDNIIDGVENGVGGNINIFENGGIDHKFINTIVSQIVFQIQTQVDDAIGVKKSFSDIAIDIGNNIRLKINKNIVDQTINPADKQIVYDIDQSIIAQVKNDIWEWISDKTIIKVGQVVGNSVEDEIGRQANMKIGLGVDNNMLGQIFTQSEKLSDNPVANQIMDLVRIPILSQVVRNVARNVGNAIKDQIGELSENMLGGIHSETNSNINYQVGLFVEDPILESRTKMSDCVYNQIWTQVIYPFYEMIQFEIVQNVRDYVWENFKNVINDSENKYYEFGYRGSINDIHWTLYYEVFRQFGVVQDENFEKYYDLLLNSGIFMNIQFENLCLVSSFPKEMTFDSENRLHNEKSYAIKFPDGYCLYHYHGINVPDKWILNPNEITRDDIIGEVNAERRRVLRDIIGTERFSMLLGLEEVDSDEDLSNNIMYLYKTKDVDEIVGDHLYYARVMCPSTSREYFLAVPPMSNVWDAVAWTFGKTKDTYKPIIET